MTLVTGGTRVATTSETVQDQTPRKRGGTRNSMLASAAEVMRERGAAGVTIDAVLARSGAPRGSVYYHFPDGRNQILIEALRYSGDSITAMIDAAAEQGARVLLGKFVEFWEQRLTEGGFNAGCPVVAAAIGSDDDDAKLSAEAGAILARWCAALTRAFTHDGFDEPCAASLAVMSIAALEGAIVLSRSTGSIDPLRQVGEQLGFLIKARKFVLRNEIAE
jgi:TetR/AcrR family transcriptional regulator, lmrAB and yxaGH operons repressor